jgi:plastocyanin
LPGFVRKEAAMRRILILAATATILVGLMAGTSSGGGGGSTVRVTNFDFKPATKTIQRGGRVTWRNIEGRHTVTFRSGGFDKVISGNQRVTRTFRRRGTFRYVCRFHNRIFEQRGKIVVE